MTDEQKRMMIKGTDDQGKPIMVEPEVWRTEVLPELLKNAGDDPNILYGIISLAADYDFAADVLDAVEKAREIDTIPERGATLSAIVHLRAEQYDAADKIIDEYFASNEKTGMLLATKARILVARDDKENAQQVLDEALDLDPNNEMALSWTCGIVGEKHGEQAVETRLESLCETLKSWRAATWLAHRAIESKDKARAVEYYQKAIQGSDSGVEAITLAAIDLLQAGYVIEMIPLVEKAYDPEKHGPDAGLCLVQGYIQTGRKQEGILMLNQVEGVRPELGEPIMELRKQLASLPSES